MHALAETQAVLEWVGAGAIAGHPIQRISGGEIRRVLLARALLRKPNLLVLDEPVQGVDITGQAELYKLINAVRRETGRPAVVGFGVSTAEDVRSVCGYADGVIVGSAIVSRMLKSIDEGDGAHTTIDRTVAFVKSLLGS